MDLHGKKVILGSNSPRRRELLKSLNIDFEVDTGNNFEERFSHLTPYDEVPRLMSEGKSLGFHRPGEILGKPRDREDAARMLRDLSGRKHHVTTGVTLRDRTRTETFTDTTEVWFKPLSDAEIFYYIDTFAPFDKAGAYAIQEWIGAVGITRIDGSYSNVVGLPVHRVWEALQKFL